jgi:hypothetical protein
MDIDEDPGLSDQYRMASPWPLFVALGLPIAEVGILFDLFPVAVGGLLLFCGSISGLVDESGYSSSPWRPLVALAACCLAFGAALVYFDAAVPPAIALDTRGFAVIAAGALLLAGGVLGPLVVDDAPTVG